MARLAAAIAPAVNGGSAPSLMCFHCCGDRGRRRARRRTLPQWSEAELLIIAASPCERADIEAAPKLRGIVTPTIAFS